MTTHSTLHTPRTTHSAPATLHNTSEARHHHPQQDQAHFIQSGARSGKWPRPMHSGVALRCGLLLLLQLLAGCALPLRFVAGWCWWCFLCVWWCGVAFVCAGVCGVCGVCVHGVVCVFLALVFMEFLTPSENDITFSKKHTFGFRFDLMHNHDGSPSPDARWGLRPPFNTLEGRKRGSGPRDSAGRGRGTR